MTNYLGPFLLTLGLLPSLEREAKKGEDCRIVNVVSILHEVGILDMSDPLMEQPGAYSSDQAYGQSKMAMVASLLDGRAICRTFTMSCRFCLELNCKGDYGRRTASVSTRYIQEKS